MLKQDATKTGSLRGSAEAMSKAHNFVRAACCSIQVWSARNGALTEIVLPHLPPCDAALAEQLLTTPPSILARNPLISG